MSRLEIDGMGAADFSNKATNSVFLLNDDIVRLETSEIDSTRTTESAAKAAKFYFKVLYKADKKPAVWKDARYTFWDLLQSRVDLTPPTIGYLNKYGNTYMLARESSRQWRVGLNSRTFRLHTFFNDECIMAAMRNEQFAFNAMWNNPAVIWSLYNRTFFNWQRALMLLRGGRRISCAINHDIAVGNSRWFDRPVILYKNHPIGFVAINNRAKVFETADYTARLFPLGVNVDLVTEGEIENVAVRSEWDNPD